MSENEDYRLRGADTLFRLLPPVSVYRFTEELSESKSGIGFSLLQTAGGYHQSVNSCLALKR